MYVRDDATMMWYYITDKQWWQIAIKDFTYGEISFIGPTTRAIIDSGNEFIEIPPTAYTKLLD